MSSVCTRRINIDAGILSSVVLLGAVRVSEAEDHGPPDTIKLTGVVRDFLERSDAKGHPDFERKPDHGFGLYCGNVSPLLGPNHRPVFTGTGQKVTSECTDADGRPIAPHLANARFVSLGEDWAYDCETLKDSKGKDAFEVCLTSATFNEDGTSTWVYNVRELPGGKDLSHWNLKLDPAHKVMAGTTPGYDHEVDGSTGFYGIKWDVTDGFGEGEFTVVLDGHYAGGYDDAGVLATGGNSADTGRGFVPGPELSAIDAPYPTTTLTAEAFGDKAASMSYSDTGGIESADSFKSWYRDVLGVNLSRPLTLTLARQDDGSYVFDDKDDPDYAERGGFFPVDDRMFGNSGNGPDHNYHFTFELHAEFTYDADGDQLFKFIGDDDVWVFIDGKLVIDLGGVHSAREQYVDLGRLGLGDGETYRLDFFFAERHRTQSNFRIETNLALKTAAPAVPPMTVAAD